MLLQKSFVKIFFFIFLINGIWNVKNYGISYDELDYRQHGFVVLNYIGENLFPEKAKKIIKDRALEYPKINDFTGAGINNYKIQHTLNAALEYMFFKNKSKREQYIARHYINFIFAFLSLIIFYKTLRIKFSRLYSLLGITLFISNPRIVAEINYNPNDVWMMYFVIFYLYGVINYFKTLKKKYLIIISIAVALAINVRIIGIYLYPLFLMAYFFKFGIKCKLNFKDNFFIYKNLILQFFFFLIFLFTITPQLWYDPMGIFKVFLGSLTFEHIDFKIWFESKYIFISQLPFYYLTAWILISTPLVIILFLILGFFFLSKKLIRISDIEKNVDIVLVFLVFVIPFAAAHILKPHIFNGWRHFYFLYPSIIYIALYGFKCMFSAISKKKIQFCILLILFINISNLFLWSIKNHPYQYVYLNHLSKKYAYNYELDYWGLSNTDAIRNIIENKNEGRVNIAGIGTTRINFSYFMLTAEEQKHVRIVKLDSHEKINYYITNFQDGNFLEYYLKNNYEVVSYILVDDLIINATLKKIY